MKSSTLTLLALFSCSIAFSQIQEAYFTYHPTLSPDGKTIVFSYEGDLWKVPVEGGLADRITAMDGMESRPKISPDGQWLTFIGTQFGNADLFLMPLEGGAIRQLTYHSSGDDVPSWDWDSETIYFTSNGRDNRMSSYQVSVNGGTPKRLFGDNYFNQAHKLVKHPVTGDFFFNESWESYRFAHRRNYKGAYNPDVKSWNPTTKTYKEHTDFIGKDFDVTIDRMGNVYFVSDEYNGAYNLYQLKDGKKTRLTRFDTPVYHPFVSADGSTIIFQKDYQIFTYDVAKKKSRKVQVQVVRNPILSKTKDFKVQGNMTAFDVSDDNKKLVFVSRGELFVSDIKGKFVRQIATPADGRVGEVYFLKDNKTLIFNQTVGGYQNWFTIAADGSAPLKQLTSDKQNNRNITFNSDKSKAVYLSGRNDVRLMDLESMESKTLFQEELWGFYNDNPQFSPDDRYILFTAYRNFERDLMIYDLQDSKKHNLTNTGVSEVSPYWSPDGKYIYFASNRLQPSYPFGLQNAKIYRMALQDYDKPFRSDKFEDLFKEEEKKEEGEKKEGEETEKETKEEEEKVKKPVVTIDFEGLLDRVERISPSFGSQYSPYVVQKDDKTMVVYGSNHDEGKFNLWKTTLEPFESNKTAKIAEAVTSGTNIEEADGNFYLMMKGNIYTLNIKDGKTKKIDINHSFKRNLQSEFEQMFYETWANLEENFYDDKLHGINWLSMQQKYAAYLPHLNNRADLRRLVNDMLGELNTSHFGFYSNGKEEKLEFGNATLATGIRFANNDPYLVKGMVKKGPADKNGKDIQPGDRLIAVNGQAIDPAHNREHYFSKPSREEEMSLTFSRNGKKHEVKLHPASPYQVQSLLYDEWIANNQKRVDEKSGKRIAYAYMKNMGNGQLNEFLEDMVAEGSQREAVILDLRYNTGGNVHDKVLQFLSQKPYLQWRYRGGQYAPQPNFAPASKPIVLLINEQSLSDAEMTAQGFKQLELGTIIGTETYRWIIFTSGKGLVDGSFYRLPSWGCYTLDGENLEKTGVSPDITVRNTFEDRVNGRDPQLDRAIEEISKMLKNQASMDGGRQ